MMSIMFRNKRPAWFTNKNIFLFFTCSFIISVLFSHIYSVGIDNYYISCVLNGVYSKDNYCRYLHPLLAGIISFLNTLIPNADFFCILQILFTICCNITLMLCIYHLEKRTAVFFLYSAFLFSLSVILNIAHSNFTIAASFFTFTGIILQNLYILGKIRFSGFFFGLFFICLGLLWRPKAALLFLPFFLLSAVFSVLITQRQLKKRIFSRSVLCIVSSILCIIAFCYSKKQFDSSSVYADAAAYDVARGRIQDYLIPSYEASQDSFEAAGISENDYAAATDMLFLDISKSFTALLKNFADICRREAPVCTLSYFISVFIDNSSEFSAVSIIILLILSILYLVTAFKSHRLFIKLEAILAAGGSLLIMLYYYSLGRLLDRIIIPVLMGLLHIAFVRSFGRTREEAATGADDSGLASIFRSAQEKEPHISSCCLSSGCLAFAVFSLITASFVFIDHYSLPDNVFDVKSNTDYGVYESVLDNRNLYIWDTYYMKNLVFETLLPQGKIYSEDFVDNNIPDGEWTFGQAYFNDYLSNLGIENLIDELLYNENCYYISRQYRKDVLLTYIHEHYDADATVEKCGDIVLDGERSLSIFRFTA